MRMRSAGICSVAVMSLLGWVGVAKAVVVDKTTFQGSQVSVFFSATTSIVCADAGAGTATVFGFLSGGGQMTHSPGGRPSATSGVSIEIDYFNNSCTGQTLSFALGGLSGGITGPNGNLSLARLVGTTTVNTFDFPPLTAPVSFNVTLSGTDPITRSKATSETRTATGPGGPFTITVDRSGFSSRSGTASGTVTVAGIAFNISGSQASLLSSSHSTITVSK